ncbi:iron complex outermembrane recepter protein [Sphingomonas sp. YR710]|uniref:TonB-dependent receptor n=1 Tax=Sphingomonas sp. YR710 TaxID=1882773 RepID=UPI000881993E|nr:TonB-dependent receptor [Sphingomonas sp. YR710]SDD10277.1 iron complex outermembrane recepter protein [Sphingomonas sp. YR710]
MKSIHLRVALLATASIQFLADAPAFAQSANGSASAETIIVTARRVEERLQDVPISISVVSQDQLTKANITSSEDLTRVVPGLNVQSRFSPEQASFSIRGFSQLQRTSATVGTYFGEVVSPRGGAASVSGGDGAGPGTLFDLQNVQVLKGPQGTLFGRNTTGGAVILTPRKPTGKLEGYVEGSYGNYNMRRLQGVINVPVASWARLRIGADYQKANGFLHNVSGIGPHQFANTDYIAVRGSLVLDVTPDLENYTIVSYLHSHNNGSPGQIFQANPTPGIGFSTQAQPQIARYLASGDKYQIEQDLNNPEAITKQFQVINTTKLAASDTITIKNILSYSTYIQDVRQQAYSTNFLVPALNAYIATGAIFHPEGVHTNDQNNFTEELQLQGRNSDSRLIYQAGLYFEHSTPGSRVASTSPSVGAVCLISGFTTIENSLCRSGRAAPQYGSIAFTNMAAYAQATYALTPKLKLTGGVRYTYDRSRGESTGFILTYVSPTGAFVNPTVTSCGVSFTPPGCTFSARTSDKKPTWTLNLAYSPNEDMMFYGTYSRGYRQGAVTPFAVAGSPVFGPEKVDNYEAGTKLTLRGPVSGNLNLAGFYSDLSKAQLSVGLQNSVTGQNASSILNAGKARIYGVEFDGTLRFARLFRVNGSLAYINSKLNTISLPATFPGYNIVLPSAVAGDPLPYTPKWGVNIGGTFTLPVDESVGVVELSAAYRYNSSYTSNASSVTTIGSTPVKQLDLNLDWRNVAKRPVDISLFAANVTNQFTQGVIVALINQLGYNARYVGRPRTYGVRARFRFGE